MNLLDILHALPQVLAWVITGTCALVLIIAACAPRAADLATDHETPSRLDDLDRPALDGLTEWDLDRDTHDPADLCEAYPWECDWDDVPCCHGCATGLGPCFGPGYQHICLTHHREGADQ